MPNETELKAYTLLEEEITLARSRVPSGVRRSKNFAALISSNILRQESKGSGYIIRVVDISSFTRYLDAAYPGRHQVHERTAAGNIFRYRSSKAGKLASAGVVLLRGEGTIELNGENFDLDAATRNFGCAACLQPSLATDRLCLVENLSTFLRAEELLGKGWTFLHTYGRLGSQTFNRLDATRLLHFGDYDYTGLDEYLRLKSRYPHTELYCPNNLEDRWQRYSLPLKEGATKTTSVFMSQEPVVVRIRALLNRTNRFLEQQALFINESRTT